MSLVFVGAASSAWEWLRSPRTDGRPAPRASSALLYLFNQGFLAPAIAVALAELGGLVHADRAEASWSLGQLAIAFVAFEAISYGIHRLLHRVPWLFRLHRVHHTSHELGWIDAFRQHPLEFLLFQLFGNLPAVLLFGRAGQISLWLNVGFRLWTAWLHASVPLRLGPLEYLLTSPRMHHRHHRAIAAEAGSGRPETVNYGGLLSGFDWLFGTARR
ncbi:MAG TPA: sterol desaturase family protein [Polyangiaceae bacterium]|nr:sterol desaturase family protein [Polyangiaceae bacterium]